MINLLPPDLKKNYVFARRNTALLHTLIAFCLGIFGLAALSVAGILYLHQTAEAYNAQAAKAEAELRSQNQAIVEKQVTDISGNLKLAVQVLSQEVLFSKLLEQLTVVTPSKVSLSSLRITKFGGGLDLAADTIDHQAATQLQVNMTDPANKIFSTADIVSINCVANQTARTSIYPCQATYRALFAKDNPFVFINGKATP